MASVATGASLPIGHASDHRSCCHPGRSWMPRVALASFAIVASSSSSSSSSTPTRNASPAVKCKVLENLEGLHCYGMEQQEADEELISVQECEARCCEEPTCEAWQYHAQLGCWHGNPYSCEASVDKFADGAVGGRLRSNKTGKPQWTGNMQTFNQVVAVEPYSEGPDEMIFQTQDYETFRVRRFGPAVDQVEVENFCWCAQRQPGRCCVGPVAERPRCFPEQWMQSACCRHSYGQGGEPWYRSRHMEQERVLSFFGVRFPSFEVNETAFEWNRRRWRVGQYEADRICAGGWGTPFEERDQSAAAGRLDWNATNRGDIVEAVERLVSLLSTCHDTPPLTRTFVNIGAGTCAWPDPLHTLQRSEAGRGFRGLAVEQNPVDLAVCMSNLPGDNDLEVHGVQEPIMLPNVTQVLEAHLPKIFPGGKGKGSDAHWPLDVLVVDIDSWDCLIVEELLHSIRPKVIVVEMAFYIPPPFRFSMHYQMDAAEEHLEEYDVARLMPASGCSLSYAVHAFLRHGYLLLRIAGTDAIFVHSSVARCFEAAFGVRLPADEFSCYRRSRLWMQAPASIVREWFFAEHPAHIFSRIWSNLTKMLEESGRQTQPFTLDY